MKTVRGISWTKYIICVCAKIKKNAGRKIKTMKIPIICIPFVYDSNMTAVRGVSRTNHMRISQKMTVQLFVKIEENKNPNNIHTFGTCTKVL